VWVALALVCPSCGAATVAAARRDERQLAACPSVAVETRESSYVYQRMCSTVVLARGALDRSEHEEALRLAAEAAMGLCDDVAIAELSTLVDELPPARALPLIRSRMPSWPLAYPAGDSACAGCGAVHNMNQSIARR
jgi:hypothetical protein